MATGGLQRATVLSTSQTSSRCPHQPRSPASLPRMLQWQSSAGAAIRPCLRRAAVMKADKESAAEETTAEPECFEDEDDGCGLTTHQVEAFLSILCEDTEIAELELQMGSFQLKVRRSLSGGYAGSSAASGVSGSAAASVLSSQDLVGSLPSYTGPPPSPVATQSLPSFDEADESIVCIRSPKVGILRRGRYVKGKQIGKSPVVDVGDKVKKGQTVGYVEQLGTFVAVEAPQAGEIASFLADEGQPVEYGEDVVELAPFFGGHIIGDSKYL